MTLAAPSKNKTVITAVGDLEIHLERVFNAPLALVWDVYTDAELMPQWLGPRDTSMIIEKMDLRSGGSYRYHHTRGEERYTFSGEIREVVPMQKIVQTFRYEAIPDPGSVETATFTDLGDGRTKVTVVSVFSCKESRDGMLASGMEVGVNDTHARLDEVFADRQRFPQGRFCWTELHSQAPEKALAFYTAVMGWTADAFPLPDGSTYHFLKAGGQHVGALQQGKDRPHWLGYVSVDDVAAKAAEAQQLGAKLLAGPLEVMTAGRMAVIADPTGAVVAMWQPRGSGGAMLGDGEPGSLCWHDLYSPDAAKEIGFYGPLFGWTSEQIEAGGMPFFVLSVGEESEVGLCEIKAEDATFRPFFSVADIQATVAKVKASGGKLTVGPIDMGPRIFAHCEDVEGVGFGLMQLK